MEFAPGEFPHGRPRIDPREEERLRLIDISNATGDGLVHHDFANWHLLMARHPPNHFFEFALEEHHVGPEAAEIGIASQPLGGS